MRITTQNAHYSANTCFTSSRLTFSPTAANITTLYDTHTFYCTGCFRSSHLYIKQEGIRKEAVAAYCKLLSEQLHYGSEEKHETICQYGQIRGRDSISDVSNTDQRCQSLNSKYNQNPTYILLYRFQLKPYQAVPCSKHLLWD